jgi:hypothetical protein
MRPSRILMGAAAPLVLGASLLAGGATDAQAACNLQSAGNKIRHVVYIQFDNVHLRRDNPNVPSDLELMPNLLNFLTDNGTVSGNHHTPLISHTATDYITAISGLYPNRMGIPVANSFGFFRPDGSVGFTSSFGYWTDTGADGKPQMIGPDGKIAPAPWVAYTRAGCNVGSIGIANIEFENIGSDITTVFGANSSEAAEAKANPGQAAADFEGVVIHCAKGDPVCAVANGRQPDLLPDEPGGYNGFNALYGNKFVAPQISPAGPMTDLDGNVITDGKGHVGFPGFNELATQSLAYGAAMLEHGVPVVYLGIADLHDRNPNPGPSHAFGPGEAEYVAQAQAYDKAFGKFFARLAADGITAENTLFVVTSDENDHFIGGPPNPANCDGIATPCTYKQIGEISAEINRLLLTERGNTTPFLVHSDDAPTFYITGNPGQTDPVTRALEQDVGKLTAVNPLTGNKDQLTDRLADIAEQNLLHMVTASPARTMNFVLFGNENYFFFTSNGGLCTQPNLADCVFESPGFAWNHGDFQQDITRSWFGMVGPGVKQLGRNDEVFSDHTDLRPTMMSVLGLQDDFLHDGRVLIEDLEPDVLPHSLKAHRDGFLDLAQAYKQLNAPVGSVGLDSLVFATRAIESDDETYEVYLEIIGRITAARDELAGEIKTVLDDAAFNGKALDQVQALGLIARAKLIIAEVAALAN